MSERTDTERTQRAQGGTNQEPELIPKKEVLERTGISYGQFYRWKRKGLIPESWFVRKSTFTGQETFLPREKILERIRLIQKLKDEYSLEEIAEMLSPEPPKRLFPAEAVRRKAQISGEVLDRFRTATGREGPFRFREVFWMAVLDELRKQGASPESWELALRVLQRDGVAFEEETEWVLWLLEKDETPFVCLAPERYVRFDPEARERARVELRRLLERVKMRLAHEEEGEGAYTPKPKRNPKRKGFRVGADEGEVDLEIDLP